LIVVLPFLHLQAQVYLPVLPAPIPPDSPSANPDQKIRPPRAGAPDKDHIHIEAVTQEADGVMRHFRGSVRLETTDMMLRADEVDYNTDTGDSEARGHVHFEQFVRGEKLDCDHMEYNLNSETGKFYDVSGSASARIQARRGLLITQTPFYFQGKWAERLEDHYILHDGFLTDCVLPAAWWRVKGPIFYVIPGDHAIARNSWFYLKGIPLVYFPYFYKSLKKEPRRSGFLIPNFGNSSSRGKLIGEGYYWAINRSYDLTYRARYYTLAGFIHHVEFKGDPDQKTSFDIIADGTKDRRQLVPSASGVQILAHFKSDLGDGWLARGELDYINSFAFRQQFTQSFNEAVFSETHSLGYVTKHWADFGVTAGVQQNVDFQSTTPHDDVSVHKLPEVDFSQRERQIDVNGWPFWYSFDSSAGLLNRTQILYQTRPFVDRLDFAPRVTTAVRLGGLQIVPSVGLRETSYGSSFTGTDVVSDQNVLRSARYATVDLILPSLERVFKSPSWLGDKVKHVIEPRVTYQYTTGIDNFARIIHFDETDVLANTNQLEFSLANRLLAKDKNGVVSDLLTWKVWYDRYFDPTFGGAIIPGQRNVFQNSLDLTGYAFLNGYRRSSPVVSALRLQQSRVTLEWRADYDPVVHHFVDSSLSVEGRIKLYHLSIGQTQLKTDPVLAPAANQLRGLLSYGSETRRGISFGVSAYYDYLKGVLDYSQVEATYNTDCCGLSVQYGRFNVGVRDETQLHISFSVSNIGSFGTLPIQQRIF
jgi:LPS-assembly protein